MLQHWHVVSGDWQLLDDEARQRFWPLVADRLRVALGLEIDAGELFIDALALPFYRVPERAPGTGHGTERPGRARCYSLVQVGLAANIDFVGLERWCFFLWDGADDLAPLDGLASTIDEFNERVGIDLAESDPRLGVERAAAYIEFFCAFLLASPDGTDSFDRFHSPFLPLTDLASCGWSARTRAAVRRIAEADGSPYAALRSRCPVADLIAEAGDTDRTGRQASLEDRRIFRSAALANASSGLILLYGRTLFRAQIQVVFSRFDDGAWRSADVRMLDDDGGRPLNGVPPLFVRSWSGRVAFYCVDRKDSTAKVSIRPGVLADLLKDRCFLDASRGDQRAFAAIAASPAGQSASSRRLLRLLAVRHWGGPYGDARITVVGNLVLASAGEELQTRIELVAPVRVEGDLIFSGATFVSPVVLEGWTVEGRVDGSGARALRSLELRRFRVANRIGLVSAQPGKVDYPDNAVKLEELRVQGSLDLGALVAEGGLSLQRARVGGRLVLEAARLHPHDAGGKSGRFAAGHAQIDGSVDMARFVAFGNVELSNARIGGDLDLSGAHLPGENLLRRPAYVFEGRKLSIGGDLLLNRYRPLARDAGVGELLPTMIGGGFDGEDLAVGGSVFAFHCQILGDLDLRGARVGRHVHVCGQPGADRLPAAVRATIVRGEVSLYGARIGGNLVLDGTFCTQLDFNFLEAASLFARPDEGAGLPLVVSPLLEDSTDAAESPLGMQMSHARIGGVSIEGARIGGGLRAIKLCVDGNFQLRVGEVAASFGDEPADGNAMYGFALHLALGAAGARLTERLRPGTGIDVVRREFRRAYRWLWRAAARPGGVEVAVRAALRCRSRTGRLQAATLPRTRVASAIDGDLVLDGIDCAGNLDLLLVEARMLSLDGARISNKFRLAEDRPGPSGRHDAAMRACLRGGLLLRNAFIGGVACLDRARVIGRVEWRDSRLDGGASAVDCVIEAVDFAVPGAVATGGGFEICNVRFGSGLRLPGLIAADTVISDCRIAGDLSFGRDLGGSSGDPASAASAAARVDTLRVAGSAIDGRLVLGRLAVAGGIDISETRALRGLQVEPGVPDGQRGSVACRELDLTRFGTDGDVDLAGLRYVDSSDPDADIGARSEGAAGRSFLAKLSGRWRRYRDDLRRGEDAGPEAGGDGLLLRARHATIAGVFRLPRSVDTLHSADLSFASADVLEVAGDAFHERGAIDRVGLVLRGARFDSARLIEPLPRRVDMREAVIAHWEIDPASDPASRSAHDGGSTPVTGRRASTSSANYLAFVHRSWPYTQAAYTKLEQDYRDGGQHKDADAFVAAAGWRTWRWSMIRPAFEHRAALWLIVATVLVAALVWHRSGIGWAAASLAALGSVYALLSPIEVFRRASRLLIGAAVVAPFQLIYGFGLRWWLPLLLSAAMLVVVTLPVLSDCRNLQASDGSAAALETPTETGAAGSGRAARASPAQAAARRVALLSSLGIELGPSVVASCRIGVAPRTDAAGSTERPIGWNGHEALWMALRYHLPVVPLDTFFHGDRAEKVRPSTGPLYLAWGRFDGSRFDSALDWISPATYARAVYLLSWLVIPFSLIFAAARIQRKFRLQKD